MADFDNHCDEGGKMDRKQATRGPRYLPPIGTRLVGHFKGQRYEAVIIEVKDFPEKKGIHLNKKIYRSMTAAATAISKQSVNGWRFWKIQ
jgi:hypothetical protein